VQPPGYVSRIRPDLKGRSLYLAGILVIVATVAILYLIFVPSNGSAISQLVTSYSTTQLFRATLTVLGANGVLLFLGGFFALSAFFAAIPSAGAFSSQGPRIAGLFFLQQIVYWPLIFVFLISPYSFLAVLPYYLALAIPMTFALKPLGRDLTYEEFAQSKSGQWGPTMALTSRKFLASNILSSVITFELLFVIKFDVSLTLLSWFLFLYTILFAILLVAYSYGFLFQLVNAKRVIITTLDDKEIECFLVAKGEDHYIIRTPGENMLLQGSFVKRIRLVENPKQDTILAPLMGY
jgi:hypothetical protein